MPRTPSIARIETCELAIQQILNADIPDDVRATLLAAKDAVTTLRPSNVDPADHLPVYTTAANGDPNVIGCSCGDKPAKRAARASMAMSHFHTHLNRVGLPRPNVQPTYAHGPYQGMTWEQRRAALTPTARTRG